MCVTAFAAPARAGQGPGRLLFHGSSTWTRARSIWVEHSHITLNMKLSAPLPGPQILFYKTLYALGNLFKQSKLILDKHLREKENLSQELANAHSFDTDEKKS
jgi:hypothetical protein